MRPDIERAKEKGLELWSPRVTKPFRVAIFDCVKNEMVLKLDARTGEWIRVNNNKHN